MDAKPHRLRKWLIIGAGIAVGVPLLFFFILFLLAQVRGVRPDQLAPPPGMVHFKKTQPDAAWADVTPGKISFEEFLSHGMPADSVEIYRKWSRMLATDKSLDALKLRKSGEKLTPEQLRWLNAHRDDLQDLIRMAASTGGKPILSCEQAIALNFRNSSQVPSLKPMEYRSFACILSAESMRRRMEGDAMGAADAILAAQLLAKSISQPELIGHLVGTAMELMSNREMAQWIKEGSVPPEVARRFREQAATQLIGRDDTRNIMQFYFEITRREYIDMLNGPITGLFRQYERYRAPLDGHNPDDMSIYELVRENPGEQTARLVYGAGALALMKANASGVIEQYDSLYARVFNSFDRNDRLADQLDRNTIRIFNLPIMPDFPVSNFDEVRTRTMTNVATLNLDLAGLSLISGTPVREPDPYTNDPLKTNQQQDATIIYSLGPDQTDNHGAVTYDPTNGTFSAGDIILRIPRR
ncbi:hypothetical protein LLG95_08960 [bacterium]|nr:hypothetical protein [bacterium]